MTNRQIRLVHEYFHPWPNSAGFYLARERGWYSDAGIDLEFTLVDPAIGDGLHYLLRGDVHFAVFPSSRLLQRRDAGQPLLGIAAVNQRGLETVRTTRRTGITRMRDLEGKRIALNPTVRGVAIVRDLVSRDGGDPDLVTLVDAGTRELDAHDIEAGEVDATYGSYWAWDNLLGDFPADQQLAWNVDEHLGVGYHSYLLGTHDDIAAADPELVRTFVEVTRRGFEAAAAEPGILGGLYEPVLPYFPRPVIAQSAELVSTTWLHDGAWGTMREELLAPYSAWMAGHDIIHDPDIWRAATTSEFLTASARSNA